jgi:hypothetical protein
MSNGVWGGGFLNLKRSTMPANFEFEPNNVCVRISGLLKHSEFSAGQDMLASKIDAGARPRVLAIAQDSKARNAARIGMTWIFFFRTATRLPGSPSWRPRSGRPGSGFCRRRSAPSAGQLLSAERIGESAHMARRINFELGWCRRRRSQCQSRPGHKTKVS